MEMSAAELSRGYKLTSDIAQFCLPASTRDANRRLAYVNSICCLFLTIGLIGFQQPKVIQKELAPLPEIVPVVYTPPEEPPKQEVQPQPEEPELQPRTVVDVPQIATVVAADPSQAKFAVPVEGPVVFAPAQFAQAPPPGPPKTPDRSIQKFTGTDGGTYGKISYPREAMPGQLQGTTIAIIAVKPDGTVESVEIKKSSGHVILDRHTIQQVKIKYKFPPVSTGEMRYFEKDFVYNLE